MNEQQRAAFIAIDAAQVAIAEAVNTLRASLTPVEPPAPEPPPPHPPAPPPPPTPATGLQSRVVNMAAVVQIGNLSGDRYRRFQSPLIVSGAEAVIPVAANNMAAGGGFVDLAGDFTLTIDGEDVQTLTAEGVKRLDFTLPLADLSEGWHWLDVRGQFQAMPIPVYVRKGEHGVPQSALPIVAHEHAIEFKPDGVPYMVHWGMVPNAKPTPRPIALGAATPFSNAPRGRALLACESLVPSLGTDVHRPVATDDGVLTTAGSQYYFWHHVTAKIPALPLTDGQRGVAMLSMPTHLEWGKAFVPELGGLVGNLYGCDPWRVFKVRANGEVVTLFGWRSQDPPHHWNAKNPRLDLVGDWSAIPEDRRGMHETWGIAWDERTFAIDETAERIADERNLKPHITGVVMFVTDSQNNRVLRAEFDPRSHKKPPKITEFLAGLADPWDVVCKDGVLYVSERKAHRIAAYNATTGALLRVVMSGADLGGVTASRFPFAKSSLSAIQAEQCVLPEGLFLQDDWLYFGSRVMQQVRRVNVVTGELQVVVPKLVLDGNSNYVKLAVSDGTFGPRGAVFVVSWSVNGGGFPHAYLPDGTQWHWLEGSAPRGTDWPTTGYATAVAIGNGRLACGGVQVGINVIRRFLPSDIQIRVDLLREGKRQWYENGYHLLHGYSGFGHFGLPLPFGESAAIDEWLKYCGHSPNGQSLIGAM